MVSRDSLFNRPHVKSKCSAYTSSNFVIMSDSAADLLTSEPFEFGWALPVRVVHLDGHQYTARVRIQSRYCNSRMLSKTAIQPSSNPTIPDNQRHPKTRR
jgi:hypothetical protein